VTDLESITSNPHLSHKQMHSSLQYILRATALYSKSSEAK